MEMKRYLNNIILLASLWISWGPFAAAQRITTLDKVISRKTPAPIQTQTPSQPPVSPGNNPAPSATTATATPPLVPAPATPSWNATTQKMPATPSLSSPSLSLPQKGLQAKPMKISVPSFEKEYQELLRRQAAAAEEKRRKKFAESLKEDLRSHGLLYVLAIVIGLLVYALRKEKTTPTITVGERERQADAEAEARDIWQEY